MTVLVTGGAGYIGSHMIYGLMDRGEPVVAFDSLVTGNRFLVPEHAAFVQGDIADDRLVTELIRKYAVDSVVHLAASSVVSESMADPLSYYQNNTAASRTLIEICIRSGVRSFVFSSSASVYGNPEPGRVDEESPERPVSPYGRSKLMTEWILKDASRAHPGFRHVSLRYFNVAGADQDGRTGPAGRSATHLFKRCCEVALGRVAALEIYGTDYATADGTGVRDYIHVSDLVEAHLLALNALRSGPIANCYNCGYGRGFSVRDVVRAFESAIGRDFPIATKPRRSGDPSTVIADPGRLERDLGWKAKYDNLGTIVRTALVWEEKNKTS